MAPGTATLKVQSKLMQSQGKDSFCKVLVFDHQVTDYGATEQLMQSTREKRTDSFHHTPLVCRHSRTVAPVARLHWAGWVPLPEGERCREARSWRECR